MFNYLLDKDRPNRGTALTLVALVLINALALTISNIGALSGFLTLTETYHILIVNIVDMLFLLLVTALVSSVIDRIPRTVLLRLICVFFATCFILLYAAFKYSNIEPRLIFAAWYLISEQQWLVFPIVITTLSGDLFNTSQNNELQPMLSGVAASGSLTAGLIFLIIASLKLPFDTINFLIVNAIIYGVAFIIIGFIQGQQTVNKTSSEEKVSLRKTLEEGWHFMRITPAFTYLAAAIVFLNGVDILIEFGFYDTLTSTLVESQNQMEQFYSGFRLLTNISVLISAGFVAGYVIKLLSLKNVFFIWPATILIAAITMILLPNAYAAGLVFALSLVARDTLDEPARRSLYALVPDDKRGRVSILYDSYMMSIGTIIGSLVGLFIVWVTSEIDVKTQYIYLGFSAFVAVVVLFMAMGIRKNYDSTLLNWKLKRRKRGSKDIWKALDTTEW